MDTFVYIAKEPDRQHRFKSMRQGGGETGLLDALPG